MPLKASNSDVFSGLISSFRRPLQMGILLALLFVAGIFAGCGSDPEKPSTEAAEAQYNSAQSFQKDERYEEAIRRYQEVKNKFPYSRFAILSELAIADTYFLQESYPEAQVAYQNFKDMHPKHPKVDYVTYKLGLCYYLQLPPGADRDLSLADKALQNFDEVIRLYPGGENAKDAQEKKMATLKMLAEKEVYIADFYFKKGQYLSAMNRYEGGLRKYPGQGFDAKILSRAAICAARQANLDHARTLLKELEDKFPDSSEAKDARKEIQ